MKQIGVLILSSSSSSSSSSSASSSSSSSSSALVRHGSTIRSLPNVVVSHCISYLPLKDWAKVHVVSRKYHKIALLPTWPPKAIDFNVEHCYALIDSCFSQLESISGVIDLGYYVFATLPRLSTLHVRGVTRLNSSFLQGLNHYPNLTSLSSTCRSIENWSLFPTIIKLRHLELSNVIISAFDYKMIAHHRHTLETLHCHAFCVKDELNVSDFSMNHLHTFTCADFDHGTSDSVWKGWHTIQKFYTFAYLSDRWFRHLTHLNNLTSLQISC
jgi:hypothetical protein